MWLHKHELGADVVDVGLDGLVFLGEFGEHEEEVEGFRDVTRLKG